MRISPSCEATIFSYAIARASPAPRKVRQRRQWLQTFVAGPTRARVRGTICYFERAVLRRAASVEDAKT